MWAFRRDPKALTPDEERALEALFTEIPELESLSPSTASARGRQEVHMHDRDAFPPTEESIARLHRSGWSTGETAFYVEGGGVVWVVDGSNGENRIRAEGATQREVWWRAVEQAAECGMLADWLRPSDRVNLE
jgi:hypothetical protein